MKFPVHAAPELPVEVCVCAQAVRRAATVSQSSDETPGLGPFDQAALFGQNTKQQAMPALLLLCAEILVRRPARWEGDHGDCTCCVCAVGVR